MTETAERLKAELAGLSMHDRAELASHLIRSLDVGVDSGTEAAWDAELARRVEEIQGGQAVGEPANDVFDQPGNPPS